MLVPIPKPPTTAITSIVSHHTTGNSPLSHPVNANGSNRQAPPMSASLVVTSTGPPAACRPTRDTNTIAKIATMP
jgi:hypothetical protein